MVVRSALTRCVGVRFAIGLPILCLDTIIDAQNATSVMKLSTGSMSLRLLVFAAAT